MTCDFLIIGGGIVGISTAWQLKQRFPDKSICVLEKAATVAQHQTGHNSGVIHAGVYYPPDSLKAKFCREGLQRTIAFCQEHHVPYEQCGKLLVATNALEMERMQALFERCQNSGLAVQWLTEEQLQEREPNINGIGAFLVHDTGIVDYPLMTQKMAEQFQQLGGKLLLQAEVMGLSEHDGGVGVQYRAPQGQGHLECRFLICCAGLQADRVTRMMGIPTDFQIIPFRGEYYRLPEKYNDIVQHLIYPIPDPDLPFLGVHLTRMIDGSVTVGPNAVQGWKREGYGKLNLDLKDVWDMVRFPGFWRVLAKHWKTGLQETKNSWLRSGYLREVQKYCPQLQVEDLLPYPAGVRAQAVLKDGTLVHDFLFAESQHSLHVCNAPSPAATSALPIGAYICDQVAES